MASKVNRVYVSMMIGAVTCAMVVGVLGVYALLPDSSIDKAQAATMTKSGWYQLGSPLIKKVSYTKSKLNITMTVKGAIFYSKKLGQENASINRPGINTTKYAFKLPKRVAVYKHVTEKGKAKKKTMSSSSFGKIVKRMDYTGLDMKMKNGKIVRADYYLY